MGKKKKPSEPEIVVLKAFERDMPIHFYEDHLVVWLGFHGWFILSQEQAITFAETILAKFKKV